MANNLDVCAVLEKWMDARMKLETAKAWAENSRLSGSHAYLVEEEKAARAAVNGLLGRALVGHENVPSQASA